MRFSSIAKNLQNLPFLLCCRKAAEEEEVLRPLSQSSPDDLRPPRPRPTPWPPPPVASPTSAGPPNITGPTAVTDDVDEDVASSSSSDARTKKSFGTKDAAGPDASGPTSTDAGPTPTAAIVVQSAWRGYVSRAKYRVRQSAAIKKYLRVARVSLQGAIGRNTDTKFVKRVAEDIDSVKSTIPWSLRYQQRLRHVKILINDISALDSFVTDPEAFVRNHDGGRQKRQKTSSSSSASRGRSGRGGDDDDDDDFDPRPPRRDNTSGGSGSGGNNNDSNDSNDGTDEEYDDDGEYEAGDEGDTDDEEDAFGDRLEWICCKHVDVQQVPTGVGSRSEPCTAQ
mmetsp:Transcript_2902/g.6685  ORF Transcript_2902/g.6685 Transcript_2902/m.6685 type:complete len:338 (+) Transcript_2902:169-1182(+)